jgi:hypothetical protein
MTDDKIYCFYLSANKEIVEEQAGQGGFPADWISRADR